MVAVGGTAVFVAVGGTTVAVGVGLGRGVSVGSSVGVSEGSGVGVLVGPAVAEGRTPVKVAVASVVGLVVTETVANAVATTIVGVWVAGKEGSGVGSTGEAVLLLNNKNPMAYKGTVRIKIPKYSPRRWGLNRELRFMRWRGADSRTPLMLDVPPANMPDPLRDC